MSSVFSVIRDTEGNVLTGVTVTVYDAGTTNLSSIFSDSGLSNALANPFTNNADGSYQFFAAAGNYDIKYEKTGMQTQNLDTIVFGTGLSSSRTITCTAPLTIDGGASADLSADRTLAITQSGIDHGSIGGLTDDDHTNYVHISTARTVSARHTFSPSISASPFIVSGNGVGQLVGGLNADQVDGIEGADLTKKDGTVAFTGHVSAVNSSPTNALHLASKGYVDGAVAGGVGSRAKVYDASTQAITTATPTSMAWDTEEYDTDTIHDNATNNNRLTIPSGGDGTWMFIAQITWASNATGTRVVRIKDNAGVVIGEVEANAVSGTTTIQQVTAIVATIATDWFEVEVEQDSGGNLNVNNGAGVSFFLAELLPA